MRFALAYSLLIVGQQGTRAFVAPTRHHAFLTSRRQPSSFTQPLFGILDEINSDSYDLMGSSSSNDESKIDMNNAYEMFLGELVFSTNDPRVDIMDKYDLATDPEFLQWLEQKIAASKDPEERMAIQDLLDMIVDVQTRVEVSALAEKRAKTEAAQREQQRIAEAEAAARDGREMSTADILKKATQINTAASDAAVEQAKEKKTFYETELTPEIRLSYEQLLKKVLPPYKAGDSPASIAFNFYDQFDAQFVKVLAERSSNGDQDSKALLEAIAVQQQKKIAAATEAVKAVLSKGEPMMMEGAVVKMAREGKIDEAFLLLLEANENQARSAGANGPADLMKRLRLRAADEKDKQSSSKEIALLRKLLRNDDSSVREKILEDAFTPRQNLLVAGTAENMAKANEGEAPDQDQPMPDVPPPDFINACKAVLLNFGNLGADDENRGDLAMRIRKLAGEAEVVATRIYGKGMTLREQQDRMWEEQTTSIFDLETMEIEAERNGEVAPWANPNADDMMIPGFDKDGKMRIGGT